MCLPAAPILILGFLCLEGKEVWRHALAKGNTPGTYSTGTPALQQVIPAAEQDYPSTLHFSTQGRFRVCGGASGDAAR